MHTVHLNNNQIFIDSPDFNAATTYTGYFDLIRDFKPGMSFKNQSFYDALSSQKFSTYGFGADYHPGVIENKSSFDFSFKPAKWLKIDTTSGFSYRYSHVWAGEERTVFQVIDRRDLSIGASRMTGLPAYFQLTASGVTTISRWAIIATMACLAWPKSPSLIN
jgi:iron complex outermembrane receptor protein